MFSSQSSHQSASEQKLTLAEMGLNFLEDARQEANDMNFGLAMKSYQKSIEILNKVLQANQQRGIKSTLAQAYFEQGQLFEQMQKTTQAQECYQKAKDLGHRQPSMKPNNSSPAPEQKQDVPAASESKIPIDSAVLCKHLEEKITFIQTQLNEAREKGAITQELVSDLNRLVSQGMKNNPGDLKAHDNLATLEKNLEQLKSDLLDMEQELRRHALDSKEHFVTMRTDINRRLEKLDQVLTETFTQLQQQISKKYALLTPREEGVQLKKVKDFLGVGTSHYAGIIDAIVYKQYLIFKIFKQHSPVGPFLRILDMQSGEITQEISLIDSRGDGCNLQFVVSTAGLLVYSCCVQLRNSGLLQWIFSIKIWDIKQNKFVKTLEEILLSAVGGNSPGRFTCKRGALNSIAALPDNRLASLYNNDEIKIWDLTEIKLVKNAKLTTPEGELNENRLQRNLFALRDGSLIRYIYNTLTDLWDVNDLRRNIKLNYKFSGGIVEISGNQLAACITDKDGITILDLETGLVKRTLSGHSNGVNMCRVQDQLLISVDGDTIRLWDAHTGKCLNIFPAEGIKYFIKDPESNHLLAIKNCDVLMLKVTGLELQEGKENKDNKEDKNSNQRPLTGRPPSDRFSSRAPLFSTSNSVPSRSAPTSNSQSSVERKKSIFSATLGEGQ